MPAKKTTPKETKKRTKPVANNPRKTHSPRKTTKKMELIDNTVPPVEAAIKKLEPPLTSIYQQKLMLTVSFDEAIQINPLLEQLGKQVQFDLARHLASHGGDILAAALTGASIIIERGTVIVRFSTESSKLLKAKELRLMGKFPTLINKAGKTVENAKLTGPLRTGSA